ncbi:MAG: hypothetical protein JRI48_01910 [Deltaproteobacteria bacterium]|nr:hypothetical protein [Deltaproteobacteria bacterium]
MTGHIEGHEVIRSARPIEVLLVTRIYRLCSDRLGHVAVVKLQGFCGATSKVCKCRRVDNIHNGAQVAWVRVDVRKHDGGGIAPSGCQSDGKGRHKACSKKFLHVFLLENHHLR